MAYYYLISSLPTLIADRPMPFTYDAFLGMCKNAVSERTYKALSELSLDSENGPLVREWGTYYRNLNGALNVLRKQELGYTDSKQGTVFYDSQCQETAKKALNAENPLQAEQILLKAQFDYLDSLVAMHYFDDTVLYGYAIKLKLLERQNIFDKAEGKQEFTRLFDSIQDRILSI